MNFNFHSTHRKNWNILPYVIAILLFSSCNKDQKAVVELDGNLQISFNGIEEYEYQDENTKIAAATNKNNTNVAEITSYSGFDAITSLDVLEPMEANAASRKSTNTSSIKKLAIPIPSKIADTVRYRLIFFKTSDNSIAEDKTILAGEAPRIRLNIGTEYKWIAYSINESTVPAFDPVTNKIDKNSIANKDLLYASNTFTIQPGDNFLNLTLKRYTTLYEVNLDVRGMFGTIHDSTKVSLANVSSDLFQIADFNILAGEFTGTPKSLNIKGSKLQAITPGVNDKKTAKIHTIVSNQIIGENQLKVKFDSLLLKMDDNSIRKFKNAIVSLKHKAITGTSTRGSKYILNAMLVESGVQVGTSTTVWARSNLWYAQDSTLTGKYRFRVSPHQRAQETFSSIGLITDLKDLWKFNAKTPDATTQTAGYDPCNDVYPAGLWKMPTQAQFAALPSTPTSAAIIDRGETDLSLNLLILELGKSKTFELVTTYTKNGVSASPDAYNIPYRANDPMSTMNDLHFSGVGYINLSNLIQERPTMTSVLSLLNLVTIIPVVGGGGYYWTSSDMTTNSAITQPYYFKFSVTKAELANVNLLEILKLSLLNIDNGYSQDVRNNNLVGATGLTGLDNWRSRLNIRCVRNPTYVTPDKK